MKSLAVAVLLAVVPVALTAQSPRRGGAAKAAVQPAGSLVIHIDGKSTTLSAAEIQSLCASAKAEVKAYNNHSRQTQVYTGTALANVLARAGLTDDDRHHFQIVHSYVIATGADTYTALYSVSEIFDHNGPLLAIAETGKPITGTAGPIRLVDANDTTPTRWVKNLRSLTVVTAPRTQPQPPRR